MKAQQKSVELLAEDLKESNKLGQLLLDNTEEAHYFYSMEGKLKYVNPAFEKITGYTTQELFENNFIPFVHPDDQEWTMKLWQGLFQGEYFNNAEYRIVKKDGEVRWCLSSWKVVCDSDGRKIGIQGKQQDITDSKEYELRIEEVEQHNRTLLEEIQRKEVEETLKEEQEKAQRYLDTVEAVMVSLDTSGHITLINRKGCDLLGYEEQELLGKNWFDTFLPREGIEDVKLVFRELMQGNIQPVEYHENPIKLRNGEERIIAWHNSILRDENDNISGTLGAGEDITKRKQTEEKLQASEQKFRSIFDFAPLGMAVVDEKGYPVIHNAALQNMLGYREEELRSMAFVEFTHPDDATKDLKLYEALYNNRFPSYSMEKRYIHKDGSIVWGALTVSAIRDENNKFKFAVGMVDDITDRKKAELKTKDLLTQNRDLTQRLFQVQEQERRHLAQEIHDEYGQWLTALRMHVHMLDERLGMSEPNVHDSLKIIENISSKMHESIRRMIRELKPLDLDVLGLVDSLQELIGHWQELYPLTHCVLNIEGTFDNLNNPLGITIYRIIQESLTNVAKHAEASNVTIQLSRSTDKIEDTDFILIRIEDDGIGIDPDSPLKGFGLAGMRERVLAARGEYVLNKTPGEGALIEVRLPTSVKERRKDY